MIWVTHANYAGAYRLNLTFSDGTEGEVDLQEIIANDPRPIFKELRNIDLFKKFRVDMDTIVWDNGLDLAPEFLYDQAHMMAR